MEDAIRTTDQPQNLSLKYPTDAALFGPFGPIATELCACLIPHLTGTCYHFMDNEAFLALRDPVQTARVYWTEMLFRVHWATTLNLIRHQRWQTGCTSAMVGNPNFLSFVGNLRGLLESCLDAHHSLGAVPQTLAVIWDHVQAALLGQQQAPAMYTSQELEELLIHFVYARKLRKDEQKAPGSHRALEPKEYRKDIPEPYRSSLAQLYNELCGYFHPTAFSVGWLCNNTLPDGNVQVVDAGDETAILELSSKHRSAIEFMLQLSINTSALCLKTLNWFSLPEVACLVIERWNFSDVQRWRTVEGLLQAAIARSKAVRRP
jgi:hypothetical protein